MEFVQVTVAPEAAFPIAPALASGLLANAEAFEARKAVRTALLELDGAKEGPDDTVDYLGKGLNYARLCVTKKAIHVDNSLNASELLKIYRKLLEHYPSLLILDLQSGQLHSAASYADWWSRPL
jgi:hypothetical protein